MKIQRGKKSLIWIQLNLGLFPRQNESSTLRRAVSSRVFCFSWNVSTCSTCEESCGNAGLSSPSTTAQVRRVVPLYGLFLIWGISPAWNKLPIPAFSFRVLDYTLLCSPALLGASVLFWMVGQRGCSVSPIDSVPTWSNAEDYNGTGLLHPSCFSASSEQGCVLARLLARKPGGCWMLNKASERHRNHSVLMHLITHIPEYILTWQFGLSRVKQLMKFQLVQDRRKKKTNKKIRKRVNLRCLVFSSFKGRGGRMLPSPSPALGRMLYNSSQLWSLWLWLLQLEVFMVFWGLI